MMGALPVIDFYPRPLRGGRLKVIVVCGFGRGFLSTPSARRATYSFAICLSSFAYFYPRPLRGGRLNLDEFGEKHTVISIHALCEEGDVSPKATVDITKLFLSTPSARRATAEVCGADRRICEFLSTPSARRATDTSRGRSPSTTAFLSTPSARRATLHLREWLHLPAISIHALCEEGDLFLAHQQCGPNHFYPRPLRGGRQP